MQARLALTTINLSPLILKVLIPAIRCPQDFLGLERASKKLLHSFLKFQRFSLIQIFSIYVVIFIHASVMSIQVLVESDQQYIASILQVNFSFNCFTSCAPKRAAHNSSFATLCFFKGATLDFAHIRLVTLFPFFAEVRYTQAPYTFAECVHFN